MPLLAAPLGLTEVDVIGDVHGCVNELRLLLDALGFDRHDGRWRHSRGRVAVFLGDLVDRGPANVETLLLVDRLVADGCALVGSIGNHDHRLYESVALRRPPKRLGALRATLAEIDAHRERAEVWAAISRLFSGAPSFIRLDGGRLLVVHAAMRPDLLDAVLAPDRDDPVSRLCYGGETNGQLDADGRTVRTFDWIDTWQGRTTVVFGHNVCGKVPLRYGHGNVVGLDTGCVFGGTLSAFRWPAGEFVSVPALGRYTNDTPVLVGVEAWTPPWRERSAA